MYAKILLVVIIAIVGAFLYLHIQNPGEVTFVVSKGRTYVLPVTLLVFYGFLAGAALALINSLIIDAKRAIRELRGKREKKIIADADDSYHKGVEALIKGDTIQARSLIERAIKLKPADAGMVISLSDAYMRENRRKEAIKILENGIVNNPGSVNILTAYGKCSLDSGEIHKATKAFEEAVSLDPKNPYALRKLRDIRIKENNWAEAARLQKDLLESAEDEVVKDKEKRHLTGLLFEAASAYAAEGKLSEAVSKVKEVLKNDDSFMPAHMLLGDILFRQGSARNAIKVWEKAQNKYPNSVPLFLRLEDAYLRESAPDRILEKYKTEISARPADNNLRLLLARLYLRLEMVDNAIEELERIYHEGGDTFYNQVLLGEAYLRRKQSAKAAHLFQKALGLDRELMPPFVCTRCGHAARAWSAMCPSCGQWNTLSMNPSPAVKAIPKIS